MKGRKRMRKTLICGVALAFICSTGMVSMAIAQDKGPEVLVLKTAKAKKPATFPHAEHQGRLECGTCHHSKGADGKQVAYTEGMKIEKCETCHNKTAGMPKGLDSFKNVAHKKCKGCHKESGNKKLTKCGTCHPKKK